MDSAVEKPARRLRLGRDWRYTMIGYPSDVAFTPAVKRLQDVKGSRKRQFQKEGKRRFDYSAISMNSVNCLRCSPFGDVAPFSHRSKAPSSTPRFLASLLRDRPNRLRVVAISSPKHSGLGKGSYPRNAMMRGRKRTGGTVLSFSQLQMVASFADRRNAASF